MFRARTQGTYPRSIFLLRHGETAANASRVVQTPEAPLSERGVEQAERLAVRLARQGVEAIVSSDYARARQTAERLHATTGANVEFWPDLRERNFGLLRGRPYAELQVDIFAPDYAPPGGETWGEFHARVARVWKEITALAANMRGNLAVVSHGLVCRSVAERLVGLGDHAVPAHWPNASLTIIGADPPPTIVRLNCIEHLADLVSSTARDGGSV
jgi:2,3-bisphosphoglycerate-dependent phosphoglycerate mutase